MRADYRLQVLDEIAPPARQVGVNHGALGEQPTDAARGQCASTAATPKAAKPQHQVPQHRHHLAAAAGQQQLGQSRPQRRRWPAGIDADQQPDAGPPRPAGPRRW
jgi:hypothetical protein